MIPPRGLDDSLGGPILDLARRRAEPAQDVIATPCSAGFTTRTGEPSDEGGWLKVASTYRGAARPPGDESSGWGGRTRSGPLRQRAVYLAPTDPGPGRGPALPCCGASTRGRDAAIQPGG